MPSVISGVVVNQRRENRNLTIPALFGWSMYGNATYRSPTCQGLGIQWGIVTMDSVGESGSIESGTPLPPVNADDLKRVWGLMQRAVADHGLGIGIDVRIISQECEPGADVNAVFFRAAVLQHLFESRLLDEWREGDEPAALVFQVGAIFPMEQGVQGFDPADFIERLHSKKP